jgi:alpha-beta hydrolase superfamily lysophospholipase
MNLLLLPGNSQKSGEWLHAVEQSLTANFACTRRHDYRHWQTGEREINLSFETTALANIITDYEPYLVFAKSAGTMLALRAISEDILTPKACLFTGMPLVMVAEHSLPVVDWLQKTTIPITILQNEHDPYGSFQHVSELVAAANCPNVTVVQAAGNTHDYNDFATLNAECVSLLQRLTTT